MFGDQVSVEFRPLTWDGRRLDYGPPEVETVVRAIDGVGLASALVPGDWVALHWEWVCDRITEQQARLLKTYTDRHMAIVNRAGRPAAAGLTGRREPPGPVQRPGHRAPTGPAADRAGGSAADPVRC